MALDTYGHVFAELEGAEKVSAEAEVRRARDELAPFRTARRACWRRETTKPLLIHKPSIGLEPMTPSLPWKCSTN